MIGGAPNWQAVIYLWRDTAAAELRLHCDPSTTFPSSTWPPTPLIPYTVIGTHVTAAAITLEPEGSPRPTSIAIAIQERSATPARRSPAELVNQVIFLPQNQ